MTTARTTRRLPLLLAALLLPAALVLGFAGLAAPAHAGESKTFQEEGCSWALPEGWSFMELSSDDTSGGYIARAGARAGGAYVLASLRSVRNTDPHFLPELTREVQGGMASQLQTTTQSSVGEASLAGVKGTLIKLKGTNRRDEPTYIRVYGIQAGDRIHQLFLLFVGGAEKTLGAAADQARRGFKLAEGGGDEPADPELTGDAPTDGGGNGGGNGGGGPQGGGGAPVQDGKTLTFPSQNLKWSIPEGSPFEWTAVAKDEALKDGLLCRAEAVIKLPESDKPKEEFEEKGPEENTAVVMLFVGPQDAGWTPAALMNAPNFQQSIEKSLYDRMDYGRMKVVDKLAIGNHTGAAIQMVGQKDNAVLYFRAYAVGLKGRRYVWQCELRGTGTVDDDFREPLKNLIAGVEFLDTTTWVSGPVGIGEVPPTGAARGFKVGEEKEVRSLGFEATKPPEMADLDFQTGGNMRLAWEARTEDKQHYLYFDVQTWSEKSLQGTRDYAEQWIRQREGQWKEAAASPQTVTKGKDPYFKSKFGKGKGLGYEFTGFLNEIPFVEQGFVVEYKKYVYWFRIQLGGEDAEKLFSKELKAIKKAIKFSS